MRALEAFRPRPSLRLLLLLLPALLSLPPLLASAAPPAPAQTPTFEGTSQVVAVEVPVNVVGRDGEPVRGLTAADFEVYDGNEPQKITSFEVIDLKTLDTLPPAAGGDAAGLAPAASLRSGARRHFLLLFDLSFSSPTSILKARLAARDFVLSRCTPRTSRRWPPTRSRAGPSWSSPSLPTARSSRGPSTRSATAALSTPGASTRCTS